MADVLCAKPSELAFYPVPKLNIRRVGDHEVRPRPRPRPPPHPHPHPRSSPTPIPRAPSPNPPPPLQAYSALRSSELGDGTLEARELEDAMAYVNLFVKGPDLLTQMNKCIMVNGKAGLYDGCKVAVQCVLEKSFSAV